MVSGVVISIFLHRDFHPGTESQLCAQTSHHCTGSNLVGSWMLPRPLQFLDDAASAVVDFRTLANMMTEAAFSNAVGLFFGRLRFSGFFLYTSGFCRNFHSGSS